jgi:putative peptidoglycan lipid II flippase
MSEKKNIARAAGVLGFATIISRIMGMVPDPPASLSYSSSAWRQ